VPGVGTLTFAAGESIRTEISCKYDRERANALLAASGFHLVEWMTDDRRRFALALAEPVA
ncbi:MAG TPA: L-histidine N(alpha)-methyltransferase, partial [Gemmatimonadaceae bacterium]